MRKRILSLFLILLVSLSVLAGCNSQAPAASPSAPAGGASQTSQTTKAPKYIFLFIGDGMSHVQVNAAQVYLGNNKPGEVAPKNLNFTKFPVAGVATTYDATSFCPDSASTATSLSCGVKTHSGVIGLNVDKTTKPQSITEKLKAKGMKIGIVSSVTLNHATPAAFYAHIASRNDYYEISEQLASSGFDYFGGGYLNDPTGKDKTKTNSVDTIKSKGYKIANTKEDILALNSSSGKVYAINPALQDSGSMPYSIDTKAGDLTLADFVTKGIDVLDNDKGFFMMCESGKVDWACHANDAMSTISDTLALEKAVQSAVDFASKHPDETLILVTGDHETGGMTIGYAATGYNTAFNILGKQKMSYVAFDTLIGDMKKSNPSLKLSDVLPVIKTNFGLIAPSDADAKIEANKALVLTDFEYKKLENAFSESMKASDKREKSMEADLLYGTYDPLSVTLTHIINNKAGIGWTSYAHTGTPVPVYAMGAGAAKFGGSYDNTDVNKKLLEVCGIS